MRWYDYAAVILVLLFAMTLRISGTATFGALNPDDFPSTAPHDMLHIQAPLHPDEFQLVAWPVDMAIKNRFHPQFFEYPSGLINLNYVMNYVTGISATLDRTVREGANLRTIAPFKLYFFGRMYAVLAGVISVACAYAIMCCVSGRFAALMAALMLATAYLQVQHAHYIKPEIPSAALTMLVVWSSVSALYARQPATADRFYILSGIFTGAAATVRYNAAAIGIVLFLAGLLLLWRKRNRSTLVAIAISWMLVPVIFIIGTPFALLDFQGFYQQFAYITGQFLETGTNIPYEIRTNPANGFRILFTYFISFGVTVPATVAIVIGLLAAWLKRPKQILKTNSELTLFILLTPYIAAYIFVTMRTVRPIFSDNLLVLIVPHCLLLAAIGAGWVYDSVRLPKQVLAPLITFGLLIIPITRTVPMVSLISQTETRVRMQQWIYEHMPVGSRILLFESYNVPLDPEIYPYEHNVNIKTFRLHMTDDFDYLVLSDAKLDLFARASQLVNEQQYAFFLNALDDIERNFPLVARIERPRDYPGYQNMMNMVTYWHQPGIYVYCLNAAACDVFSP